MIEFLTLGQFAVAVLMGLAALSAFVWAVSSGAFDGVEAAKHQVLSAEGIAPDVPRGHGPGRPASPASGPRSAA